MTERQRNLGLSVATIVGGALLLWGIAFDDGGFLISGALIFSAAVIAIFGVPSWPH